MTDNNKDDVNSGEIIEEQTIVVPLIEEPGFIEKSSQIINTYVKKNPIKAFVGSTTIATSAYLGGPAMLVAVVINSMSSDVIPLLAENFVARAGEFKTDAVSYAGFVGVTLTASLIRTYILKKEAKELNLIASKNMSKMFIRDATEISPHMLPDYVSGFIKSSLDNPNYKQIFVATIEHFSSGSIVNKELLSQLSSNRKTMAVVKP